MTSSQDDENISESLVKDSLRPIPGAKPTTIPELVRIQDRLTFLYIEQAIISRQDSAITATDDRGTVHIPAAALSTLLLGPGTSVTHQAITLMAESGLTVVWVGERGVRYYAHGRPLATSTRMLEAQAIAITNRDTRLAVARQMYQMRFPGEDVSRLTMQQLRGREGARVRRIYRENSQRTGVAWSSRTYQVEDFAASDIINQCLSAANTCLYGLVHATLVALGCSPGLGFVHTGHALSFVYDIADLYKADITIPTAFDVAAMDVVDVGGYVRRLMRDRMVENHILDRCTHDVVKLLHRDSEQNESDEDYADVVLLWDAWDDAVAAGKSY